MYQLVAERGYPKSDFQGARNQPKNGLMAQVEQDFFFIFLLDFLIIFHVLHFEKSSNMAKNEE